MGAKNWMLAYSDGRPRDVLTRLPELDRTGTDALVSRLFGSGTRRLDAEANLYSTYPPRGEIVAGVFPGLSILASSDFGLDNPSKLASKFIERAPAPSIHLQAMHSVVDWSAFAVWRDGELVRSLSLSPDSGVIENLGEPLPFEEPFWSGAHPAVPDDEEEYVFPFHPLELAESVLAELFGFVLEGAPLEDSVDPESISLLRYKRSPWWRVW